MEVEGYSPFIMRGAVGSVFRFCLQFSLRCSFALECISSWGGIDECIPGAGEHRILQLAVDVAVCVAWFGPGVAYCSDCLVGGGSAFTMRLGITINGVYLRFWRLIAAVCKRMSNERTA